MQQEKTTVRTTRSLVVTPTDKATDAEEDPTPAELPKDNIIAKLYLSSDGDNIESMLSELGGQLYTDKKYRLTLMLEAIPE